MPELYDDIAESVNDPAEPTAGWGSTEDNYGRFWYNTTDQRMLYHNNTNWVSFDTAHNMSVERQDVIMQL